jgi:hypothetical protein
MFGLDWQARQRRTGAASSGSAGQHTWKRRDIPRQHHQMQFRPVPLGSVGRMNAAGC